MQMTENRKRNEAILKSDYANTDKLFKEQLIKTKVSSRLASFCCLSAADNLKISEFANNDLEKYGKALDKLVNLSTAAMLIELT